MTRRTPELDGAAYAVLWIIRILLLIGALVASIYGNMNLATVLWVPCFWSLIFFRI